MSGAYSTVDQWALPGINPTWWPPFRQSLVVDGHRPAALQEVVVVIDAEQRQVVQIGLPTLSPRNDVVPLAVFRRMQATGERAADVAGDQCHGLVPGGAPFDAAEIERDSLRVESRTIDLRLIRHGE